MRRPCCAEVPSEQVEVGRVDDPITCEVCAGIETGVACRVAEGASQGIEVGRVDDVIVVAVTCALQTHVHGGDGAPGQYHRASTCEVLHALDPPCIASNHAVHVNNKVAVGIGRDT